MDSQGSETTKAETIRCTGYVYLGLKVCQSPLKFDFKVKMAHIDFFIQICIEIQAKEQQKNSKNDPIFAKIKKFVFLAKKYIKLEKKSDFCHFGQIFTIFIY